MDTHLSQNPPPQVSVIIPNYNHAPYLEERINSVLNQTFQNLEVIILDDCSNDDSRVIIELYRSNSKVRHIVYNEANSGSTFKQWKRGFALAQGSYIWIAESDDWCEANFLENVMNGFEGAPSAVIGYCQSYCIDESNKIIYQSSHQLLFEITTGQNFVKKYMVDGNAIFNASMAVWKKECLLNISQRYTDFKFCGDWMFWIEIALQGDVMILGKVLNYFRKHDKDVSGGAYKSGLNFIEEIQIIDTLKEISLLSNKDYHVAKRKKFVRYKRVIEQLDKNNIRKIDELFYTNVLEKLGLLLHYFRIYAKGILRKFIVQNG